MFTFTYIMFKHKHTYIRTYIQHIFIVNIKDLCIFHNLEVYSFIIWKISSIYGINILRIAKRVPVEHPQFAGENN